MEKPLKLCYIGLRRGDKTLVAKFREYYLLTKPGIIRGNLVAAAAGFFLASQGIIDWVLLLTVLLGTSLIIASACVYNNIVDRDIDVHMRRTKKRATVTGKVAPGPALVFASVLASLGIIVLALLTNWLTVAVGMVGLVGYAIVYTNLKRRTVHGTLIGAIPGAVPPVAGYTAVTGRLDLAAGLLFLVLVFWQMPHFYAIAVFRLKEYKAAGIPVLPTISGIRATKVQTFVYGALFSITAVLFTLFGHTGITYLALMTVISLGWLVTIGKGFTATDDAAWAGRVFGTSLIVLLAWCMLISVDAILV